MKRTIPAVIASALALPLCAALPDPVTYFSFDEMKDATHVANLSGSGQDLTLGPGASLTNLAAVGKAIWFNGTPSAYATFRSESITNRTIAFWYWRSSDPGPYFSTATDAAVIKQAGMPTLIAGLNTFFFRFGNGWAKSDDHSRGLGDHNVIAYFGTGGSLGACYLSYLKYPQVSEDRWVHYAYSFDITKSEPTGNGTDHCETFDATIYVNGEKWYVGKALSATNCFPVQNVILGNNGENGQRPCHGALDELKVFDRVLTAEQVREEFARGRDAQRHRLVAWYPLQEFSDRDGSGNCTTPDATAFGRSRGQALTCSSATSVVPGPNGTDKAIHFDGTQTTHAFGTLPYPLSDFTASAWVNVSTNTSVLRISGQTANYPKLLSIGRFVAYFNWVITSTQMQFILPSGAGGTGGIHTFSSNGLTGKGNWQHMTWVVRNVRTSTESAANAFDQHLELYLNGELAQQGVNVGGATIAMDATVILGSDATTSSNRPFEGDVSDLRIYDGAMNADEVRRLFRGAADVEAGPDQTVKGARAVLCGTVAAHGSQPKFRTGYAGDVAWSLVSAPVGGEDVAFLRPSNPVCEVDLPVEGSYVFRLETRGFPDASASDTVTVVRDDANGTPGVAPAVDVATVASNATVRAGLAEGLIRHWTFNGLVRKEEVSGKFPTANFNGNDKLNDWSKARIVDGVTGNGVSVWPGQRGGAFYSNVDPGEVRTVAGAGCRPDNEWLTVSAWIKPESMHPADWFAGVIVHLPTTLSVSYGKYYSPHAGTGPIPGMSILQTGIKGHQAYLNYDLPADADLADKWSHVVALVNRHETSKCELYLNGVRLAEDMANGHRSCSNYGEYTEEAYKPFNGQPCGGRAVSEGVCFGNTQNELGGVNNTIFQSSNTTTYVTYSRHFPGAIDEVRFYNRKLTETEIRYLATHPDPNANAAPVVAKATVADMPFVSKAPNAVSASAADDGNVGAMTYEWLVVKGDPSQVTFADRFARETTVTVKKAGAYAFCLKVTDGERITYGEPVEFNATARGLAVLIR